MENKKVKLACYWACGCGGCDVSILDTDLKVLDLAAAAEIVFWPIAVDFKERDVEAMPDGSIDLCLFNGSIRNEENLKMALLLRKKSKVLVAFGTCAYIGGIHGLINTTTTARVMETVFTGVPSVDNPDGTMPLSRTTLPEGDLSLPKLYDTVRSLDQVVEVDYYVPGCPPASARVGEVIDAYLTGKMPPRGTVLGALEKALCDTCPRKSSGAAVREFTRPHLVRADDTTCLLEQGLVCLGPVTRGGCGELCVRGNMPCSGCYGPTSETYDPGAAMVGVLASLVEGRTDEEAKRAAKSLADPLGDLYRFTMAASLLRKVRGK
jgi:F420-non-reducing hydrogenase small subunit